jgi:hypothetical protein
VAPLRRPSLCLLLPPVHVQPILDQLPATCPASIFPSTRRSPIVEHPPTQEPEAQESRSLVTASDRDVAVMSLPDRDLEQERYSSFPLNALPNKRTRYKRTGTTQERTDALITGRDEEVLGVPALFQRLMRPEGHRRGGAWRGSSTLRRRMLAIGAQTTLHRSSDLLSFHQLRGSSRCDHLVSEADDLNQSLRLH